MSEIALERYVGRFVGDDVQLDLIEYLLNAPEWSGQFPRTATRCL